MISGGRSYLIHLIIWKQSLSDLEDELKKLDSRDFPLTETVNGIVRIFKSSTLS